MEHKNDYLWDLLDKIPESTAEQLGLDDLIRENPQEADQLLRKLVANKKLTVGFHTSDILYKVGDLIKNTDSRGKYKGKIFYSNSIDTAFTDDHPHYCYLIDTFGGKFPDPDDLVGGDWFYTLTPAKIISEVPLGEVYRAKKRK